MARIVMAFGLAANIDSAPRGLWSSGLFWPARREREPLRRFVPRAVRAWRLGTDRRVIVVYTCPDRGIVRGCGHGIVRRHGSQYCVLSGRCTTVVRAEASRAKVDEAVPRNPPRPTQPVYRAL